LASRAAARRAAAIGRRKLVPKRISMTIELYVFPPSPRAFKVLAVANHLGLDFEVKLVDLRKRDHKSPQYSALNPNMRMPTLKHGNYVLWESNAIQQYLALQKPDDPVLPKDEKARIDVTRWQFWDLAHWDPPCAVFVYEHLVKPAFTGINEPDQAALAKAEEPFHRAAAVLNTPLRGKKYVTRDTLTLADFCLGAVMNVSAAARFPLEAYAEIGRWFKTLQALPAWQKTLAQSGALS
jgi:glutathione S-transferase